MGTVKTLLHVEASPRKDRSASLEVARSFVDALKANSPGLAVDTMDLWKTTLPEFDGAALQGKYAGLEGRARNSEEEKAWSTITTLADRLKRADVLLFSVPMWNWTIPYKLKHLIDLITQKDVLFSFDEKGMNGLLHNKRAVCVYARGIDFTPGTGFPSSFDHQKPYMETWLNSIGVTAIDTLMVQKTLFGPELDKQERDAASEAARALAAGI
ncbi:FMN-dependent NADH-azoreductase [Panacagrimonas perspica]|uniref:FMN dependent NADH:quinone oxidoreductase n=1 Tax=Panacagrimonas perspica TaxID=381431 RepID=A0A4R7NZ35_9GAMM|nr:NAD(P)H-dependent oxidoreductase [Panacagrimonas perspica]TDU26507.1 FMN-dependent NADH-azoreductase [Panacagrimonas perspica]THD02118.1 FMN-dependent NADH-azoreductase [Panacagrimonas perspica]